MQSKPAGNKTYFTKAFLALFTDLVTIDSTEFHEVEKNLHFLQALGIPFQYSKAGWVVYSRRQSGEGRIAPISSRISPGKGAVA